MTLELQQKEIRLHVIHSVADLRRQAGGIASILYPLCISLSDIGISNNIITFHSDTDNDRTIGMNPEGTSQASAGSGHQTTVLQESVNLLTILQTIERHISEFANKRKNTQLVLHSHGLWSPINFGLARAARKFDLPLVVSLHGNLLPWARHHKFWKKELAWRLYQARDLRLADQIHVTSDAEQESYHATNISTPAIIIPFGMKPPELIFNPRFGEGRRLIFLGRVHPIKNLISLIRAWHSVRPEGWRVIIAGPDDVGHVRELKKEANLLEVTDDWEFRGPVYDDDKWHLIAHSNALVLPSHTENFGAVVAEALACSRPVIASTGTPWADLETNHCGWWVEPSVEGLSEALRALSQTSPEELNNMGQRGQALIEKKYSWKETAEHFARIYSSF